MPCRYMSKALRTCYERGVHDFENGVPVEGGPYGVAESRSGRPRVGPQHYAWLDGWMDAMRDARARGVQASTQPKLTHLSAMDMPHVGG